MPTKIWTRAITIMNYAVKLNCVEIVPVVTLVQVSLP